MKFKKNGTLCATCKKSVAETVYRGEPICRVCFCPPYSLDYLRADFEHHVLPRSNGMVENF